MAEAQSLGIYDSLLAGGGNHTSRHVPYGEGIDPATARERMINLGRMIPGVPGSLCLSHPAICNVLNMAAERDGARLHLGVERIEVRTGRPPEIGFAWNGDSYALRPELVVGADGRKSAVARQIGLNLNRD